MGLRGPEKVGGPRIRGFLLCWLLTHSCPPCKLRCSDTVHKATSFGTDQRRGADSLACHVPKWLQSLMALGVLYISSPGQVVWIKNHEPLLPKVKDQGL